MDTSKNRSQLVLTFEIFRQFLLLGCVGFGGPAAHIGYFRKTFVEQLGWLDEDKYAQLVALSQFLPGPGSSQVGFAIGYGRAGLPGAVAAFLGFTLPAFFLMFLLAILGKSYQDSSLLMAAIHTLKLLAVVVVVDAIAGMWGNLCNTRLRATIAVVSAVLMLVFSSLAMQMGVLLGAALLMGLVSQVESEVTQHEKSSVSKLPFILFILLFFSLPWLKDSSPLLELINNFYQAGSLVFGGGHVVLPLLQQLLGNGIDADQFLMGYAAAQGVPGPMFSLAAFLGAELWQSSPLLGAALATLAIFVPGFLLVLAFYNSWSVWAGRPRVAAAMAGVNAAVVGLLIAALYQPVFSSAVEGASDIVWVLAGLLLLRVWKLPIVALVALFLLLGFLQVLVGFGL